MGSWLQTRMTCSHPGASIDLTMTLGSVRATLCGSSTAPHLRSSCTAAHAAVSAKSARRPVGGVASFKTSRTRRFRGSGSGSERLSAPALAAVSKQSVSCDVVSSG